MYTTLTSLLLFCLFSFLFGIASAFFVAWYRAVFSALRLLPRTSQAMCDVPKEDTPNNTQKAKKMHASPKPRKKRKYIVGYFLFDLSATLLLAVAYLLFLYAVNGGTFRLFSLLLAALGGVAACRIATWSALPLYVTLFLLASLPRKLICFVLTPLRVLFRRHTKKTHNPLDETEKIV